ncbi:hypothetical protein SNEBB_008381 [Seison nebaliae]|nr:hypothetical protein SNEBB_008381 [Seison nebaliae]
MSVTLKTINDIHSLQTDKSFPFIRQFNLSHNQKYDEDVSATYNWSAFPSSHNTSISSEDHERQRNIAISANFDQICSIIVPLIFSLITLIGAIGNFLVIYIILINRSMRYTTTNILILNLAFADMLFILFCVPWTAYDLATDVWLFGDMWCKISSYSTYLTAFLSVYLLVIMSFDRYLAVVHPVKSVRLRNARNAIIVCFWLWIVLILACMPLIFVHQQYTYSYDNVTKTRCLTVYQKINGTDIDSLCIMYMSIFGSSYVLPLILILSLYSMILQRLRNATTNMSSNRAKNEVDVIEPKQTTSDKISSFCSNCLMGSCCTCCCCKICCPFGCCWRLLNRSSLIRYRHTRSTAYSMAANNGENRLVQNAIYSKSSRETIQNISSVSLRQQECLSPKRKFDKMNLFRRTKPNGDKKSISKEMQKRKRKVTRMVTIVVAVFAICWAPYHLYNVLKYLFKINPKAIELQIAFRTFAILSQIMAYMNSCINPFLYNCLSENFRMSFIKLLGCAPLTRLILNNKSKKKIGRNKKTTKNFIELNQKPRKIPTDTESKIEQPLISNRTEKEKSITNSFNQLSNNCNEEKSFQKVPIGDDHKSLRTNTPIVTLKPNGKVPETKRFLCSSETVHQLTKVKSLYDKPTSSLQFPLKYNDVSSNSTNNSIKQCSLPPDRRYEDFGFLTGIPLTYSTFSFKDYKNKDLLIFNNKLSMGNNLVKKKIYCSSPCMSFYNRVFWRRKCEKMMTKKLRYAKTDRMSYHSDSVVSSITIDTSVNYPITNSSLCKSLIEKSHKQPNKKRTRKPISINLCNESNKTFLICSKLPKSSIATIDIQKKVNKFGQIVELRSIGTCTLLKALITTKSIKPNDCTIAHRQTP